MRVALGYRLDCAQLSPQLRLGYASARDLSRADRAALPPAGGHHVGAHGCAPATRAHGRAPATLSRFSVITLLWRMPELPEVEVLRRSLEPRLLGRRVELVVVHSPALREPLDRRALERLTGRRIESLKRRAKYLLINLEGALTLVIHLGMSGRFTLVPADAPIERHEHLAFHLGSSGGDRPRIRLRLVDPRRFGLAFALPRRELETDRHFAHLGVEPLSKELTAGYLRAAAGKRRGPIKSFLMDARIVVGVGNIYACEALWQARVHPRRSVARISVATWGRLTEAVRGVLAQAIEQGGTTLKDFIDGEGNSGYFQVSLAAYGREGEPCHRCDRALRRIVQSNRGTFYCPGCQR